MKIINLKSKEESENSRLISAAIFTNQNRKWMNGNFLKKQINIRYLVKLFVNIDLLLVLFFNFPHFFETRCQFRTRQRSAQRKIA